MYISPKDNSPEAVANQFALGNKYISTHRGEISYSSTVLVHDLRRHKQISYLFNDDQIDVTFHLVFKDRASHDAYQVSDSHANHFIPESNPNWKEKFAFRIRSAMRIIWS
jgi:hypothetical protein